MPKPTVPGPSWAPRRVLDVDAQQADRPLMATLHRAMAAAVEPVLRARLGVTEADLSVVARSLSRRLAFEFAGGAWATLLSRLDGRRNLDGLVDPDELLPQDLQNGRTPLLEQVRSDARHFGLTASEINAVMAETLGRLLAADSVDPAYLRWPLRLRVERQALRARLHQAGEAG